MTERAADQPSPLGGIVRATRRPPGWVATGPSPVLPPADRVPWPREGEDLCWLAGDWRIIQRVDGHRFSLDDVSTAHFAIQELATAPAPEAVLDLGCGIGTVLMFLAWRFPDADAIGVEAQSQSADMARRSITWNGIGARCHVIEGDLRDVTPAALATELTNAGAAHLARHAHAGFRLITGTPPYFPVGTGLEAPGPQKGPCRFEHRGGIEGYCITAARLLAPDGVFVSCGPSGQRTRVESAARDAGLAITRRREVIPREGKPPLFTLVAMRRAEQPGVTEVEPRQEPPLLVRDREGRRTQALIDLRTEMGMPP